jgi:hypothetical protein
LVYIFHHKTGERVWYPLEDDAGPLCPEIETRLAGLKRLGVAIVLNPAARGKPAATITTTRVSSCARRAGPPACPSTSPSTLAATTA